MFAAKHRRPLFTLPKGTGFAMPELGILGILVENNPSASKVRINQEGTFKTIDWSLATEVEVRDTTDIGDLDVTPKNGGGSYPCLCGKVCSSTSGLTLHRQRCPVYKQSQKGQ
jgi:hypothetical protein